MEVYRFCMNVIGSFAQRNDHFCLSTGRRREPINSYILNFTHFDNLKLRIQESQTIMANVSPKLGTNVFPDECTTVPLPQREGRLLVWHCCGLGVLCQITHGGREDRNKLSKNVNHFFCLRNGSSLISYNFNIIVNKLKVNQIDCKAGTSAEGQTLLTNSSAS